MTNIGKIAGSLIFNPIKAKCVDGKFVVRTISKRVERVSVCIYNIIYNIYKCFVFAAVLTILPFGVLHAV